MKIGIITFINTLNFGASLQAYALQEIVKENGNDAEIIKYINKTIDEKEKNIKKRNIKSIYKEIVLGKGLKNKNKKFREFEQNNINFGMELNRNTIDIINNYYDAFITGSDQVWNTEITNKDWNYYLEFVKDNRKKISYAPSFGKTLIPEKQRNEIKHYLNQFKNISVREEAGKNIIKELCDIDSEVVLDPTLLLDKEEWKTKIFFKPSIEHYILVYLPHNKKKVFEFVNKLKIKTGLPVIYLSISPRIQIGIKTIYDASPDEFLGWINNADYVVTGSFHGTAFSINLNKQFFYEPTGEGSRIDNLVKITGTESRSIENINEINTKIDYDKVNEKLNIEREKSVKWLNNAIDYKEEKI